MFLNKKMKVIEIVTALYLAIALESYNSFLNHLMTKNGLSLHRNVHMNKIDDEYDVIVIGTGIGGLSAASILAKIYNKKVGVFEKHYHHGGCTHSFDFKRKNITYNFDSGPTILLGCSAPPYNPLRQVLNAIDASDKIDWIKYDHWGMETEEGSWKFQLGENKFEDGPLLTYGGKEAVQQFKQLRKACEPLISASTSIPTMNLRGDRFKLFPLLSHMDALKKVIPYADVLNGSFKALMDAHVTNSWLKSWLNALAFSLSGLPAEQTGAAAMAYTLFDLHRKGSSLDYPRGGIGKIADVLVDVINSNSNSHVHLSQEVSSICVKKYFGRSKVSGIQLINGRIINAKKGVICNTDIWSLSKLLKSQDHILNPTQKHFFFNETKNKAFTKSFLHLHLGLNISGVDSKLISKQWKPHYTVMDIALNNSDPCADRNMVAVSNPSILDNSLVTISPRFDDHDHETSDHIIVHAYGAGNENYDDWELFKPQVYREKKLNGGDNDYEMNVSNVDKKEFDKLAYNNKKINDSAFLYRSVSKALGLSVEEIKQRAVVELIGSPLTHEHYLSRYKGTYGAAWGAMLPGPVTPLRGLLLCGDSVFPGIGIPAVALSGASAANTMVSVISHLRYLRKANKIKNATIS